MLIPNINIGMSLHCCTRYGTEIMLINSQGSHALNACNMWDKQMPHTDVYIHTQTNVCMYVCMYVCMCIYFLT